MKNTLITLLFAFSLLWQANAQNSENTSLIGMWPYGPGNSVNTWDNYAMLSLGRAVQIYDYANPQEPQLTGELFLDDMIIAFAFDNNLAFAGGYKGLYIIDITDVTQPTILSILPVGNKLRGVAIHNGYLYITVYTEGIGIVDYSDPANPFIANFLEANYAIYDLIILDNILWTASGYNGFSAWDLTEPLEPEILLSNQDYGNITGIEIFGQYLYVASSWQGLIVFDVSNLPEINELSEYPASGLKLQLHRDGNLLALTHLSNGITLYSLENPASPDSLSTYFSPWPNRKAILNNGYVMHCNFLEFNILDANNPQNIERKASIELPDIAQYCEIVENHLYVNSPSGSMMIFDVANPQAPQKLLQKHLGDGHYVVHAKDDLLFYNISYKLIISDLSTPSNPVVLDSLNGTTTITHVVKHQNLLFVADYDTLQVFDISDIHAPVRLEAFETGRIQDMKVSGNRLYCTEFSYFYFIDFSNPQQMTRSELVENMATNSIAVKDSLAYVLSKVYPSTWDYSLKIFNVKNPDNIQQHGHMMREKDFQYGVVEGDYLYVQEWGVGIHIFDIHGPTPELCGFYPVSISPNKIAAENGILYVPSGWGMDFVANDLIASAGGIYIERDQRLLLYPNPAAQSINFELDDKSYSNTFTYEIVKMDGAATLSGKLTAGQQQLNLDGLPVGVYVLRLIREGNIYKSGIFVKQY
jgi:hypothetical protein